VDVPKTFETANANLVENSNRVPKSLGCIPHLSSFKQKIKFPSMRAAVETLLRKCEVEI
jgi:hypothetical protein